MLRYLYFFLEFLDMQKNIPMKRLTLIPKYLALKTVQQIITIHILPNISYNKGNHTIKFGQFIEYNASNIFKNHAEMRQGDQLQTSFCFFKSVYKIKKSGQDLPVNIF